MRRRLEGTVDRILSRPRIVDGLIYLATLPGAFVLGPLFSVGRFMRGWLSRRKS